MREDYVVYCDYCNGEDLEHRLTKCDACGKEVCSNCTAGVAIGDDCCGDHPCDVHKGQCCVEVNGVEAI